MDAYFCLYFPIIKSNLYVISHYNLPLDLNFIQIRTDVLVLLNNKYARI